MTELLGTDKVAGLSLVESPLFSSFVKVAQKREGTRLNLQYWEKDTKGAYCKWASYHPSLKVTGPQLVLMRRPNQSESIVLENHEMCPGVGDYTSNDIVRVTRDEHGTYSVEIGKYTSHLLPRFEGLGLSLDELKESNSSPHKIKDPCSWLEKIVELYIPGCQ